MLLIGHGTSLDGDEAKFNLVGPDLSATEWADLLKPLPGRLVFVNTTGASFPFLRRVAGRGRVVLTATDSAAQQFETVFPEFFIKAFDDAAADLDKNGRVSIWEAFTYASDGVRQWFEQKGQLPTERPLLDDTGAGIGREAQNPGTDGAVARITYLEPDAALALPADTRAGRAASSAGPSSKRQLEELKAREGVDDAAGRVRGRAREAAHRDRQGRRADPREVRNHSPQACDRLSSPAAPTDRAAASGTTNTPTDADDEPDDVRRERHAAAARAGRHAIAPALNSCIRNQNPSRTIAGSSTICIRRSTGSASAPASAGRGRSTRP